MNHPQHKLSVLPLFEEDLTEIVNCIAVELSNPTAAQQRFCEWALNSYS